MEKLTVQHVEVLCQTALQTIAKQSSPNTYAQEVDALFWMRNEIIKLIEAKKENIEG